MKYTLIMQEQSSSGERFYWIVKHWNRPPSFFNDLLEFVNIPGNFLGSNKILWNCLNESVDIGLGTQIRINIQHDIPTTPLVTQI